MNETEKDYTFSDESEYLSSSPKMYVNIEKDFKEPSEEVLDKIVTKFSPKRKELSIFENPKRRKSKKSRRKKKKSSKKRKKRSKKSTSLKI
jgi:hypothetical protein